MKRRWPLFITLLLASLVLALPVQGQTSLFVITGADATNTIGMSNSSTLLSLVNNLLPRFVIEYANAKKTIPLAPVPSGLNAQIQQVLPRFVIEYANAKKVYPLLPLPSGMTTAIQQLATRFVIQYANATKTYSLAYPVALIADSTLPSLLSQAAVWSGAGQATITGTTDEFTTCILQYGASPGNYPNSLNDPLFSKTHVFNLTGLAAGAPVYYRFVLTDRSGNITNSQEYEYSTHAVFLALIRR